MTDNLQDKIEKLLNFRNQSRKDIKELKEDIKILFKFAREDLDNSLRSLPSDSGEKIKLGKHLDSTDKCPQDEGVGSDVETVDSCPADTETLSDKIQVIPKGLTCACGTCEISNIKTKDVRESVNKLKKVLTSNFHKNSKLHEDERLKVTLILIDKIFGHKLI